jgi:hypothetical protein
MERREQLVQEIKRLQAERKSGWNARAKTLFKKLRDIEDPFRDVYIWEGDEMDGRLTNRRVVRELPDDYITQQDWANNYEFLIYDE